MEDSSLLDSHDDFIILPSQEESQIVGLQEALKTLPALQGKDLATEVEKLPIVQSPTKSEERGSSPIEPTQFPNDNVTIFPDMAEIPEKSSVAERKKSTAGSSLVQHESNETQEGFGLELLHASQEDVFDLPEKDDDDVRISTPAEHIGILHLSQAPMLVPETEEDSNLVPPSPEAFGRTPMIIPGSPLQDEEDPDDGSISPYRTETNNQEDDYDITLMGTFADKPRKTRTDTPVSMTEECSTERAETPTNLDTATNIQSKEFTSQEFQAALEVPTLVDEEKSESLNLHLTDSTQGSRASSKKSLEIDLTSSEVLQKEDKSADKGRQLDEEVIVIQSGTENDGGFDDSQNFSLHLTPSQGHSVHSQRSIGQRSQMSQGQKSQGEMLKDLGHSKEKENAQSNLDSIRKQSAVKETSQSPKSQGEKRPSQRSQAEKSQSQSSKSSRSQGDNSQGSRSHSGKVRSRRPSREKALIADVNANPVVIWKDESDTERKKIEMKSGKSSSSEQITVPKDTPSEPPEPRVAQYDSQTDRPTSEMDHDQTSEREQLGDGRKEADSFVDFSILDQDWTYEQECEGDGRKDVDSYVDVDSDISIRRALTISMVQSDTEISTQPVFKLDRPAVESEQADIMEDTEDMFVRKKISNPKIIEEDSEERDDISSLTAHHGSSEEMFVATKLGERDQNQPNMDDTETYDPDTEMEVDVNMVSEQNVVCEQAGFIIDNVNYGAEDQGVVEKAADGNDVAHPFSSNPCSIEDSMEQGFEVKGSVDKINRREFMTETKAAESKEMSTQTATADKSPSSIEVVDSVVEKVVQYLQTGIRSRSRASSVCTDLSDPHPASEEADKLDAMKTPKIQRKDGGETRLSTPKLKRRASEHAEGKSPDEIKTIIQTYSSILSKSKKRRKSGDKGKERHLSGDRGKERHLSSSQRPNPAADGYDKGKTLQPRRLSTQSLPAELSKSQTSEREDAWMTARKPDLDASLTAGLDGTGKFVTNNAGDRQNKTNVSRELAGSFETEAIVNVPIRDEVQQVTSPQNPKPSCSYITDNTVIDLDSGAVAESESVLRNETQEVMLRNAQTVVLSDGKTYPQTPTNPDRSKSSANKTPIKQKKHHHVNVSSDSSQRSENADFIRKTPVVKLTNISQLTQGDSSVIVRKDSPLYRNSKSASKSMKVRQKKLKSASERKARMRISNSPMSQSSSGVFMASTQRFQSKKTSPGQDPYKFHGTQSQVSPEDRTPKTDTPSHKRKLMHRKSGLKKLQLSSGATPGHHVSFKSTPPAGVSTEQTQIISQHSDVTTTTSSGSLPSIPSTISQSPSLEPILSPSSSSSRQSVRETASRLSQKRSSIDKGLLDTIPLHHSEEDNYKKVTIVTETVEKLYREITTTRKVVEADGTVLESTIDIKKMEPVTVEENTHKKVQYIYVLSPSRQTESLTSGDLGDISSSLSKSSMSSGSLGSKRSSTIVDNVEQNQSTADDKRQESSTANKPAVITHVLTQKTPETENQSKSSTPAENNQSKISTQTEDNGSKPVTPAVPSTSVASEQDASGFFTPLGSTIDKTGSHLHGSASSVDSPKVSDSIFSSSEEKNKQATGISKTAKEDGKASVKKAGINSKQSSTKNPQQVQSVSSSSNNERDGSLISSSGTIGSRVIAKWKDGFYYPGTLKSSPDRYSRSLVKFDDGDSMYVKIFDILLIERLPAGQSVLVLTEEGDFESGLVLQQKEDSYTVETDAGSLIKFDDGDSMYVKIFDILLIERLPTGQSVLVLTEEGDFESGLVLQQKEDSYTVETDAGSLIKFDDGDSMYVKIFDILLIERLPAGQSVLVLTEEGDFESGLVLQQKEESYTVETDAGSLIKFDDGDSMYVKIFDILLIERLPAGQSVLVLTEEGDFECGLVLQQKEESYTVETDAGSLMKFDDGDSMYVKIFDILLIERLPAGQSVLVLTEEGDFESGLVLQQKEESYIVETDDGSLIKFDDGDSMYVKIFDILLIERLPAGQSVLVLTKEGDFESRLVLQQKEDSYTVETDAGSLIKFDDGDSMYVKIFDILLIERLPAGQSVLVLTEEGDFESGLVLQQKEESYTVETDAGSTGSYSFSQVILSADQASYLITDRGHEILIQGPGQVAIPANVGEVSLDNLIDTPRRTSKRSEVPTNVKEENVPTVPGSRGRKRKFDVMKPQATSTPTPKGKLDVAAKRRKGEDRDETSPVRTPDQDPHGARKSPRKTKVGLFLKSTGPLPTKKLFRGMTFLLTNIVKSREQLDQEKKLLQPSSLDTSTDESTVEEDVAVPFDKDRLKAQIESGGGTVLENFDEKLIQGKRCVLISSTFQRTIKYLQCLSSCVPCVSHMWIINCCIQNELLDQKSYILPAGISLEKRKVIEWKAKDDVFIGVKAVVHSKDNKFVETWTNILQLSKCQVHKQLQYNNVDVIVTDGSCSSAIERQAGNKNVPIVSTEWVIQSLINRKLMNYTGHPRYRHDCESN